MTTIQIEPAKLHGIATSVAGDRPTVDACATAAALAKDSTTAGVGSGHDPFTTLAKAADDVCRAARTWFTVCGNSVAVVASKSSGAADTYKHVDHNAWVRTPGGKPLPMPY